MLSDRTLLERWMADVDLRPFTLDQFHQRLHRKQRNRQVVTSVMGLLLLAVVAGGVLRTSGDDDQILEEGVLGDGGSPFAGEWVSIDHDGSLQMMTIERTEQDAHEIVIHDNAASVCSGAPSTLTGGGQVHTITELVIDAKITCDDASTPTTTDLANLTFVHDPETNRLADSTGVVWRPAAAGPILPEPSPFEGSWVTDGTELVSAASMEITHDADGDFHEIVMRGTDPGRCVGADPASTLIGTGRRQVNDTSSPSPLELVLSVELTCDDGSPLEPTGRDDPLIDSDGHFQMSFIHDPATDELASSIGGVWWREGTERKQDDPATADG